MTLNIVSFNIPYPADYGGVIDVFNRIKTLHSMGVKIILHAFQYGRKVSPELEKYCSQVYYYKRHTGFWSHISLLPYIVKSRRSGLLLSRLLENDAPILFDGLHACYYLADRRLRNRCKIVRAHNIEHRYYYGLYRLPSSFFKKSFYLLESLKLYRFQKRLQLADWILPVSITEMRYFNQKFGAEKVVRITPFHPNELQMPAEKVDKPYFLFHADLSVAENDSAARFLVRAIAEKDSTLQLVIAGKRPSKKLQQACEKLPNVSILPNISSEEMLELIRNASANILFAHRAAGVKLKLLFSLFNGRYCIANRAIVNGSGLEELCIALPADENRALATVLPYYTRTFDRAEWEKRRSVLLTQYDNRANAVRLIELLKKRAQQYR